MYLALLRVFLCICVVFAVRPVMAAEIDEAGAARLKGVFEALILSLIHI